ncbi:MAG: SdrD B-like domain-containing protein [Chloroflexota bacterium]
MKKFLALSAIFLLALSACLPVRIGGIVQGVVYGDLNGDGVIDDSEQLSRVDGAEVTLTDCGPAQTQLTDVNGNFRFEDLPEGSCHVSVAKGGWIYNGSFPDLGTYPIPVASDPDLPTAFSIYMAPVMDFLPTDTLTPAFTPTPTFTPTSAAPMVTPDGVDVNCRFGPSTNFLDTGSLRIGEVVPIRGTIAGRTWWQIEDPRNLGSFCWVNAGFTIETGDLSLVPVLAMPTGLVTNVTIVVNGGPTIHGMCGGPNPVTFSLSITTNGPATVIYHLEIFNGDDTLRNTTADSTLTFAAFGTQTFDPGGAYKTDCGDFYVKAIVTSPNNMSDRDDWSVVYP